MLFTKRQRQPEPNRAFDEVRKRNAEQDALLRELFGMPGAELGGKLGRAVDRKIQACMMTTGAKMREIERQLRALQEMCDRMYLERCSDASSKQSNRCNDERRNQDDGRETN